MTAKEMWNNFVSKTNIDNEKYVDWSFGVEADLLAKLVETGEKTATASAYQLYELENEPLPIVGEYNIILNSKNEAICIIQTKKVYVTAFKDVTAEHAYKEGEGDKSLQFWRQVHEEFFAKCLEQVGFKFSVDMKVVCEEFEVVYKK
ncbi:ASCH domain-containing protein [Faecalimonas sp.]